MIGRHEIDPVLSIECLDPVPPKPRLSPEDITERIAEMAKFPARKTRLYYPMQNGVKERVGFNVFEPVVMPGALAKQVYWPACFQLDADEALIIETELPEHRPYWNIQLNDPLFNALEYVYRLSSLNGHGAKVEFGREIPRGDRARRSRRAQLARSGGVYRRRDLWPLVRLRQRAIAGHKTGEAVRIGKQTARRHARRHARRTRRRIAPPGARLPKAAAVVSFGLPRTATGFDPAKGLLHAEHFQMAYATNDIEAAKRLFGERLGVREWRQLAGQMPSGGHIHVELAWVGSIMYELITATGKGSALYMDRLPQSEGLSIEAPPSGLSDPLRSPMGWLAFQCQTKWLANGPSEPHRRVYAKLLYRCARTWPLS